MVVALAVSAGFIQQSRQIAQTRTTQIAGCERGNKIRRQIRVQNVILQDLIGSVNVGAPAALANIFRSSQQRLRDQYNSKDLATVNCLQEVIK